jgi:hypothetical protein
MHSVWHASMLEKHCNAQLALYVLCTAATCMMYLLSLLHPNLTFQAPAAADLVTRQAQMLQAVQLPQATANMLYLISVQH